MPSLPGTQVTSSHSQNVAFRPRASAPCGCVIDTDDHVTAPGTRSPTRTSCPDHCPYTGLRQPWSPRDTGMTACPQTPLGVWSSWLGPCQGVAGAGLCDPAGPASGAAWGALSRCPHPKVRTLLWGGLGCQCPLEAPGGPGHSLVGAWAPGLQRHQAAVCDNFLVSPLGISPAATARRGQVRGPRQRRGRARPERQALLSGQGVTRDTETSFPLWPTCQQLHSLGLRWPWL